MHVHSSAAAKCLAKLTWRECVVATAAIIFLATANTAAAQVSVSDQIDVHGDVIKLESDLPLPTSLPTPISISSPTSVDENSDERAILGALPLPGDYGMIEDHESYLVEQFAEPVSSSDCFVTTEINSGDHVVVQDVRSLRGGDLLDIRPRTIDSEERSIISSDQLPADVSHLPYAEEIPRSVNFFASNLQSRDIWRSAAVCYRPLYFEDRCLERYGSITGVLRHAPVVRAGVHFAWSGLTLPLSVMHYPPCSHVYSGTPSRWEGASKVAPTAKNAVVHLASKVKRLR